VALHPQVSALLERIARSPLPKYHTVSPFVARRIYRDTRALLAPKPPEVAEVRLLALPSYAMRMYRPAAKEKLPALVYFHGGGWTIGDLDTHDAVCRQLAVGAHCVVFSVDYRLAPEHPFPAAVEDCIAATKYVADNMAKLNVRSIAVGGDSAGGNLAAVVALHARDAGGPQLAFQLLVYPATDQRLATPSHERNAHGYLLEREGIEFFRRCYLPDAQTYADWRASPLLATSHARLPPALVLTAGYDPLIDEGKAYADKLRAADVNVTYKCYDGMLHGFITMGGVLDAANRAISECGAALARAFGK
jgi:acetyl esterase